MLFRSVQLVSHRRWYRPVRWLAITALGFPCLALGQGESAADPAERLGPTRSWIALHALSRPAEVAARERLLAEGLEGASPLSLAAADLDGDGVSDLVVGYAMAGGGKAVFYPGNVDAIFPNSPQAKLRKRRGELSSLPFLAPASPRPLPVAPDFLGAADFDGDGHGDLLAAARGGRAIYFLPGDGSGGFGSPIERGVRGRITALTSGDINRRDGAADVVVAVVSQAGPRLLVFEGPHGARHASPEVIPLAAAATDLALGHLDDRFFVDLAAACGDELLIVWGRDRRLSVSTAPQPAPALTRLELSSSVAELAIGDFLWEDDYQQEIALLSVDGEVLIAEPSLVGDRRQWLQESLASARRLSATPDHGAAARPLSRRLVRSRVSSLPADDLVVIDRQGGGLDLLITDVTRAGAITRSDRPPPPAKVLRLASPPVAVLPMRLDRDAMSDLVVLTAAATGPVFLVSAPMTTFVVDSTAGDSDDDVADGICMTAGGECTLRAAIDQANSIFSPGADVIDFSIPGGGPHLINLGVATSTEALTIDGTTEPDYAGAPVVEIEGEIILNGSSTVRGIFIHSILTASSALVLGGNGNTVESCYVGTDAAGIEWSRGYGIYASSNGNQIGGTNAAARNVVSGNAEAGIRVAGVSNVIEGNYVGTDPTGGLSNSVVNNDIGILVDTGSALTTIGGTGAGAENVISDNSNEGVHLAASSTTALIQGNVIGTDPTGTTAQQNFFTGLTFWFADSNTLGGTVAGSGNLISGNLFAGVFLNSANSNTIQGNSIGTDLAGTGALGNGLEGIRVTTSTDNVIGGVVAGAGNLIGANNFDGIFLEGLAPAENEVRGNVIGDPNATEGERGNVLGNTRYGVFLDTTACNTIGTTPPPCATGHTVEPTGGNTIAGNVKGVVVVNSIAVENTIRGNSMFANSSMGIDLDDDGQDVNDFNDADSGGNGRQNYPFAHAVPNGGNLDVDLTFFGEPNITVEVDIYGADADRQGKNLIGSTSILTDVTGLGTGSTVVTSSDTHLTATATDPAGNTSEFSHLVCIDDAYEHDDDCFTPSDIDIGETQSRVLCDQDFMLLDLAADVTVEIETSNLGSADTQILVWNTICKQVLVFDEDGAGGDASLASFTPTVAGLYPVMVDEVTSSYAQEATYDVTVRTSGVEGGTPVVLDTTGGETAVAAQPFGGGVVLWQEDIGTARSGDDIEAPLARRGRTVGSGFAADGTVGGATFIVSLAEGVDGDDSPDVEMEPDGEFAAVWHATGVNSGIQARLFDVNQVALGAPFPVSAVGVDDELPAIGMDDTRRFLVVWRNVVSATTAVFGRFYDAAGLPEGPAFPVDGGSGAVSPPAVGMNGAGASVVVWEEGGVVKAQLYDDQSAASGGILALTGGGQDATPTVGMAGDGRFIVCWDHQGEIRKRDFDASGSPLGAESRVNTVVTGENHNPWLAIRENGEHAVVWEALRGGVASVWGRMYDGSGEPAGGEFLIDQEDDQQAVARRPKAALGRRLYVSYDEQSAGVESGSVFETFQTEGLIFADGFETGDTGLW